MFCFWQSKQHQDWWKFSCRDNVDSLAAWPGSITLLIFHCCPYFCVYIVVINKTDEDNIAGVNTGLWSAIYLVMLYCTIHIIFGIIMAKHYKVYYPIYPWFSNAWMVQVNGIYIDNDNDQKLFCELQLWAELWEYKKKLSEGNLLQ